MLTKIKNTEGLTLIEVLASIVLLSIVIISFISIFPQMTLMNTKTEDNLQAANVGKELLVELRNYKYDEFKPQVEHLLSTIEGLGQEPNTKIYIGQYKSADVKTTYDVVITLYTTPNVIGPIQTLFKFKIEILQENTVLTTTYGYIKN
ncbi:hypothetical protein [Psychrobacillus sp. OK032]|uniref:prepilin-type N-terminal cleavage/methylation domain-containing protein n=1 Tax=Psychrobacillus sp. OK032 TaxID=1884358 RepID=UPI0008BD5B12|nr:hypothetical protein [Psychrobacillus sp. OK032]SER85729.1 hypothetical protein SAMN05518872_102354 [Psychrobacillus sp. OK032]